MALTDYTSYVQIRALLGVEDDELADDTISLEVYVSGLLEDLLDIGVSLEADYATVNAIAAEVRSTAQQRLWRTVRSFASFSVAKRVGTSLSMFGPKDITDGKAGVSRFSDAPYKATMKNIESEYGTAKQRLVEAFSAYGSASITLAPRIYMSPSSPAFDPVTGI